MSIPVALDQVRAAFAERGDAAYLLTVSDDARPHAVHGAVVWEGERIAIEAGKRTVANAAARPGISLLAPARHQGDYSLIVDGSAAVDGKRVLVTPTKAVLHRPAAVPDPSAACADDCVPLHSTPTHGRG